MKIKEILEELQCNKGYFPYEAVKETIAQKAKIIPLYWFSGNRTNDTCQIREFF